MTVVARLTLTLWEASDANSRGHDEPLTNLFSTALVSHLRRKKKTNTFRQFPPVMPLADYFTNLLV